MRLIFDARHMQNSFTGLGRYTGSLLVALLSSYSAKNFDVVVLVNEIHNPYDCALLSRVLALQERERCTVHFFKTSPYSLAQQWQLAGKVNRLGGDYYFYPHFDLPLGIRAKSIFVVHDLLPLLVDGYVQKHKLLKQFYFKAAIRHAMRRCDRCIADSENTREDLIGLVGKRFSNRIEMAYLGPVLESSSHVSESKCDLSDGDVQAKFLLYVGDRRPHKNLPRVMDLFMALKSNGGYSGELVIAGSMHNYGFDLDQYVAGKDGIRFVGNVSDESLARLYAATDALVFLSEYEGFGLPVVEAARYARKMILSDGGSLAEIAPPWACVIPRNTRLENATKIASNYLAANFDINPTEYNSRFDWELTARKIFPEAYV
jgi:glycosyltransferase involved in cell wall biosynthesis